MPTKYTRQHNYSATTVPELRSVLNPEYDAIQNSVGETIDALADVRRADGALNNGIVTLDSLNAEVVEYLDDQLTIASGHAAAAATSASQAATSATNSANSATASANSAAAAQASETAAAASETAANQHRITAGNHAAAAKSDANKAQTEATKASASASSAFKHKLDAEAAAIAAANAVRLAPNADATDVYFDGADWGGLALTEPFSDEEIPVRRVDLSMGSSMLDLGGFA